MDWIWAFDWFSNSWWIVFALASCVIILVAAFCCRLPAGDTDGDGSHSRR